MAALDMIGQRLEADTAALRQFLAQRLAGKIELMNIVVDIMEEVANLLVRRRIGKRTRTLQGFVKLGQLVARAPHRLMQRQEGAGKRRCVLHHQLDIAE